MTPCADMVARDSGYRLRLQATRVVSLAIGIQRTRHQHPPGLRVSEPEYPAVLDVAIPILGEEWGGRCLEAQASSASDNVERERASAARGNMGIDIGVTADRAAIDPDDDVTGGGCPPELPRCWEQPPLREPRRPSNAALHETEHIGSHAYGRRRPAPRRSSIPISRCRQNMIRFMAAFLKGSRLIRCFCRVRKWKRSEQPIKSARLS